MTKKKIITIIVILVICALAIGIALAIIIPRVLKPKLEFEYVGDGYAVVGVSNKEKVYSIEIPEKYEGEPVVEIGDGAFENCFYLEQIELPNSLKRIGNRAFKSCCELTSICLPENVYKIGDKAFYMCFFLETVQFQTVVSMGEDVFTECGNLTEIYTSLEKIVVDQFLSDGSWDRDWLGNCKATIYWETPVFKYKKISDNTIEITGITEFSGKELYIPSEINGFKVESIGEEAFSNLKFEGVKIPNGVTSVGEEAFKNCENLESISFPKEISSIGNDAFYGCNALNRIIYGGTISSWCNISFSNYSSNPLCNKSNPFFSNAKLWINGAGLAGDIVIDQGVTKIPTNTFKNCSGITSITIPNSVTEIGSSAFSGCTSLTNVTIGNGVTEIGGYAFENCDSLISITIPDSVTSIGSYTFSNCPSLTTVTIGNGVTEIESHAFLGCNSLTSVNYLGTIEQWCNISFNEHTSNPLYYAKKLYVNNELVTDIVIPNTVTEIKAYAFYDCDSLKSVTIGNSVETIGSYAFYNCDKLVEVYNLSSLNITVGSDDNGLIGYYAKVIHTSLDEPSILETTDNGYIFAYVSDSEIYLVDYVGNETEITLPDGYKGKNYKINQYSFRGRNDITSVTIPNSVTSIGEEAFMGCDSITSITIPNSVTSIGDYAFEDCTLLTSIIIPNSVTSIGRDAFYGCDSLTIYCEATSKPSGWSSKWNGSYRPVEWGYKG